LSRKNNEAKTNSLGFSLNVVSWRSNGGTTNQYRLGAGARWHYSGYKPPDAKKQHHLGCAIRLCAGKPSGVTFVESPVAIVQPDADGLVAQRPDGYQINIVIIVEVPAGNRNVQLSRIEGDVLWLFVGIVNFDLIRVSVLPPAVTVGARAIGYRIPVEIRKDSGGSQEAGRLAETN
jgi:hypothetical protein